MSWMCGSKAAYMCFPQTMPSVICMILSQSWLLEQQSHISHQLADLCRSILDYAVLPVQADDTLPNYIFRIPEGWNGNGRNLGELHFWQATGATIVAIRRGTSRIVSPGPYAELYGGDEIIFVGTDEARKAVSGFFSNPES